MGNAKKQKASADKNNRGLEDQLNELRGKINDLESGLTESEGRSVNKQILPYSIEDILKTQLIYLPGVNSLEIFDAYADLDIRQN